MRAKVFIDGQAGTTGLRIYQQLKAHPRIALLEIPAQERKNAAIKQDYLDAADLVVLCLPDAAAKETVQHVANGKTKILDASTAHRTADGWVYGLPELAPTQRAQIKHAQRVSNPGCYPTGFILAVQPLIARGVLPKDYPISVNAVSGYSGGGKEMIEKYRAQPCSAGDDPLSFRPYALTLRHKHVAEMQKYTGLTQAPLFTPAVANFEQGMLVSVPLHNRLLTSAPGAQTLHALLSDYYRDEPLVQVMPFAPTEALADGFLSPLNCNDTNRVELFVFGHDTQTLLVARLDNLGKGASLAAVQNIELMLF